MYTVANEVASAVPALDQPPVPGLLRRLHGRFRGLAVDDFVCTAEVLACHLESSLLKISTATTLDEARQIIASARRALHTWIVDVYLDSFTPSGLELLSSKDGYLLAILVSHMDAKHFVKDAYDRGAFQILDKGIDNHGPIVDWACRAATIGFLINAARAENFSVFRELANNRILSAGDWCNAVPQSPSTVRRVCKFNCALEPGHVVRFYNFIYRSLYWSSSWFRSYGVRSLPSQEEVEIFMKAAMFVKENEAELDKLCRR